MVGAADEAGAQLAQGFDPQVRSRLYAPRIDSGPPPDPQSAMDALADVVLAKYAPLPQPTFSMLVHRVGYGAPQWQHLCKATVQRARQRLPGAP